MLSNMIEAGYANSSAQAAAAAVDIRHLTTAQLRMLGIAQLGYLTTSQPGDGLANYVIRGADGVAVAAFDELELVLEVANRLELTLVSVH
jgi:hypothetical protein